MTRFSQPNFTSIDSNGRVHAAFPGGIEIPIPVDGSLGDPGQIGQAVHWVKQTDGSLVAFATTTRDDAGGNNHAILGSLSLGAAERASASVRALRYNPIPNITGYASVNAEHNAADKFSTYAQVYDGVTVNTRTIINDDGQSGFVQTINPNTGRTAIQGPFAVTVPAIAAGGFATVLDNQCDITGFSLHLTFGQAQVAAGNQRVVLMGQNFPTAQSVNLLFYNPTAAASVANIPFRYAILSIL